MMFLTHFSFLSSSFNLSLSPFTSLIRAFILSLARFCFQYTSSYLISSGFLFHVSSVFLACSLLPLEIFFSVLLFLIVMCLLCSVFQLSLYLIRPSHFTCFPCSSTFFASFCLPFLPFTIIHLFFSSSYFNI